jgi:hypothetical protein
MCFHEDIKLKDTTPTETTLALGSRITHPRHGDGTITLDRGTSFLVVFDRASPSLHNASTAGPSWPMNKCWFFQKDDSDLKLIGAQSTTTPAPKQLVKNVFTTVVEDADGDDLITDEAFDEIYVMRNDGTTLNITMIDDVPVIDFYDDSDGYWEDGDGKRLSTATWKPAEDRDEDEE